MYIYMYIYIYIYTYMYLSSTYLEFDQPINKPSF